MQKALDIVVIGLT